MSDFDATIRAILQVPFVKDLRKENKRLRKELKSLKNLIYSLPEFRCRCSNDSNIKIKTEPGIEPMPCDTLADDDDVIYVEKSRETENIVYVIDDQEVDLQVTRIHTEIQDNPTAKTETKNVKKAVEEEAGAQAGDEEAGEEEEEEEQASDEEEEADAQAGDAQAGDAQAGDEEAGDEEEEAEEASEEEEEDGEVYEITIGKKSYYTTNGQNGKIYAIEADEEVGDEIGIFVNGKATFYNK